MDLESSILPRAGTINNLVRVLLQRRSLQGEEDGYVYGELETFKVFLQLSKRDSITILFSSALTVASYSAATL